MKKLPVLFLLLLAVLSLAACAAGGEPVKTTYPTAEDRVSAENPLPESSANSSESGGTAAQINV